MRTCQGVAGNVASARESLLWPAPMIVGTDAHKLNNRFTIELFSHLKQDLHEMVSFRGYRNGHSSVQVGQYLYILGGRGIDGNTLNRVTDRSSILFDSCLYIYFNWNRYNELTSAIGQ